MPQITVNITQCFHLKVIDSKIVSVVCFVTTVWNVCCSCWYCCLEIKTIHVMQVTYCLFVVFIFLLLNFFLHNGIEVLFLSPVFIRKGFFWHSHMWHWFFFCLKNSSLNSQLKLCLYIANLTKCLFASPQLTSHSLYHSVTVCPPSI